jgi:hypothetical protein
MKSSLFSRSDVWSKISSIYFWINILLNIAILSNVSFALKCVCDKSDCELIREDDCLGYEADKIADILVWDACR